MTTATATATASSDDDDDDDDHSDRAADDVPADVPVPSRRATGPRYLTVTKPHCPACGAHGKKELLAYHSVADQGDGSTMRRIQCQVCRHKFILILELPPEFGQA